MRGRGGGLIRGLIEKIKSRLGRRSHDDESGDEKTGQFQTSVTETKAFTAPFKKVSLDERPPLEGLYPYGLAALIGLFAADLVIVSYRDIFLPTAAPPAAQPKHLGGPQKIREDYAVVSNRNIFNWDNVIPDPLSRGEQPKENVDGPAVASSLPLNLVGTIVHANPAKSVASIEIKSGSKILPYFPNDTIENMAVVLKIERKKVIFRNTSTNRLEYIQIKEEGPVSFGRTKPIQAVNDSPTEIGVKRTELNKWISNLPDLLQQATAIPNIIPGTGGRVDGFKVIDIQPGSVFEKLGIKKNDVIKGVNGENIDSPAKAMELYNTLKNSARISLDVERNGSMTNLNFTVE